VLSISIGFDDSDESALPVWSGSCVEAFGLAAYAFAVRQPATCPTALFDDRRRQNESE
jgi:hypothetical protein